LDWEGRIGDLKNGRFTIVYGKGFYGFGKGVGMRARGRWE